jgi:alkyl sulfatase BDS1-like metallo-beta-lactamase superfamily hydrolase
MSMPPRLDKLKPFSIDDWAATVDVIQTFAEWQRKDMSELTAKADESVRLSEELQHWAAEYLKQAEAYRQSQEAANHGKAAQELEQEGKNTRVLAQFLGFDVDAHLDRTPTVLERVRGLRSST